MEVIKRYPQIDELISALTRIANNLDKMTLQSCPDQDKCYVCGNMEKYERALMDIQNRDDEIQDLKLENDLLRRRDVIMVRFIRSVMCDGVACNDCSFYHKKCALGSECDGKYQTLKVFTYHAQKVLEELDNL